MTSVLIIEGERALRRSYAKLLRRAGHAVRAASCWAAADHDAQPGAFDLAIVGVTLPDIDGFDVLRRLRYRGVEAPVALITGGPSTEGAARAWASGATQYLGKPVTKDRLLPLAEHAGSVPVHA